MNPDKYPMPRIDDIIDKLHGADLLIGGNSGVGEYYLDDLIVFSNTFEEHRYERRGETQRQEGEGSTRITNPEGSKHQLWPIQTGTRNLSCLRMPLVDHEFDLITDHKALRSFKKMKDTDCLSREPILKINGQR